jgi:hypothetical protein
MQRDGRPTRECDGLRVYIRWLLQGKHLSLVRVAVLLQSVHVEPAWQVARIELGPVPARRLWSQSSQPPVDCSPAAVGFANAIVSSRGQRSK